MSAPDRRKAVPATRRPSLPGTLTARSASSHVTGSGYLAAAAADTTRLLDSVDGMLLRAQRLPPSQRSSALAEIDTFAATQSELLAMVYSDTPSAVAAAVQASAQAAARRLRATYRAQH